MKMYNYFQRIALSNGREYLIWDKEQFPEYTEENITPARMIYEVEDILDIINEYIEYPEQYDYRGAAQCKRFLAKYKGANNE